MCFTPLRSLVLGLAVLIGLPVQADNHANPDLVISSGLRGGGYWSAATRLKTVAAELDLPVMVRVSPGSLHNLQMLDDPDTPVNLALTQADALQQYLLEHPELADRGEILEDIGQECVFIIAASNSGIETIADLQGDNRRRLAIVSERSGVAVTFASMRSLVPELDATEVVYTNTTQALDSLHLDAPLVDAVMVVHRPKERSPELDRAQKDSERYRLVTVEDERLAGRLPNGDRVYNPLNLALPGGGAVRTICMKGLLVSNKHKLSREQRYKLDELLNFHWMRVYVPGS